MIFADYSLGDGLLTVLAIFFIVLWIWIYIAIFTDLFRDHELSGWWKAAWVLFMFILPVLTPLVYLIARGQGMRERAIKDQAEAQKHLDEYVRETAGTSQVDELHKLNDLKEKGGISAEEYESMKAKVLAKG